MWMEELPTGKYKFFERYKDPYTEKLKKVSDHWQGYRKTKNRKSFHYHGKR